MVLCHFDNLIMVESWYETTIIFIANMTEKKYITIHRPGNILLQDEGFGVHFVRWFEKNYQADEKRLLLKELS